MNKLDDLKEQIISLLIKHDLNDTSNAEVAEKIAQVAEAHFNNQWVKCSDRLPEKDKPAMWWNDDTNQREVMVENDHAIVWAYSSELGVFKAKYDGKWAEISSITNRGGFVPTHWQPLPTPPQE